MPVFYLQQVSENGSKKPHDQVFSGLLHGRCVCVLTVADLLLAF